VDYTQIQSSSARTYYLYDSELEAAVPTGVSYLIRTQILSAAYVSRYFSLNYAYRHQKDSREKDFPQIFDQFNLRLRPVDHLFGLTFRPSRYLNVGYIQNHQLTNEATLLVQLFIPAGF
jgi:hypothetical protein